MDRKQQDVDYEDFEPSTGWVREPEHDTLVVYLPEFKKEQLKVQVTASRNLRISGERPLGNNKWSHFRVEFPIASNYETGQITAKFERGSLYIKHPKSITAEDHKPQQGIEKPKTQEEKEAAAAAASSMQKVPSKSSMERPKTGEQEARTQKVPSKSTSMEKQKSKEENASAGEVPPKTSIEKQPMEKANGVTKSADDLSQKEANTNTADLAGEDEKLPGATSEMDKNLGQTGIVTGRVKSGVEGLNPVLGGLVTEIKQPRKLLNLVVAVLLVLVVGIYARNAIRSIGKSNN